MDARLFRLRLEEKGGEVTVMPPLCNLNPAAVVIFFLANGIFLSRYAARAMDSFWLVPIVYLIYLAGMLLFAPRILQRINRPGMVFVGSVFGFVLALLFCMKQINPVDIIVDRGSAITAFCDRLVHGQFPYAARTHLGRQVSGFPGLFLVILPFYLLGDVGYFQLAALLVLSFFLFKQASGFDQKIILLVLFGTSPIFLWECLVRSDLTANMILLLFILNWIKNREENLSLRHTAIAGILCGLILLTRGIVLIPLLLYLNQILRRMNKARLALFIGTLGATVILLVLPFFLWDPSGFKLNNPLFVQSGYLPGWLLGIFLCVAFCLGFIIRTWEAFLRTAGYLLFGIVLVVLGMNIVEDGLAKAVLSREGFDLSYFAFALPFVLLSLYSSPYSSGSSTESGATGLLRS